mgnify:FL=1
MKITSSLIDKLIRLRSGESLRSSALRGEWVEELLSDGVLISRSHGSRSSIIAASPETLEQSLMHINERLGHLDKMKETLDAETTRSEQAAETGNSKLVTARSCPGFPVNSYEPIICCLNGKDLVVNPQEGTFLFIADWHSFAIPNDVTVVNIENMENFRLIRRQQSLFASALAGKRLLFVSRYPQSSDLRTWLQTIPNQYVHFGDFDLAGIHIFLTEFQKHLGARASFLIPQDIEQRIKYGSAERYNDQYPKYCHLTSNIQPLQQLIDTLHKYHRCYDQEGYIENSLTEHHII